MGMYKYLREMWKKPRENNENYKNFLINLRKEGSTVRVEKPSRLDRARSLGYKAKEGIIVVRQRVLKGGSKRNRRISGVKHGSMRRKKIVSLSNQVVCERRANKLYPNMEVLNSYWIGEDGMHIWYEVIMVDPYNPTVLNDDKLNWTLFNEKRAFQGQTSAGKKSRGLLHKGIGSEKARPSRNAARRRKLGVQNRKGREFVKVMNEVKRKFR